MTKLIPGDIVLTLHAESLLVSKDQLATIGHSYRVEAANDEIVSLKGLDYAQSRSNFILIQRGIMRLAAYNGVIIKPHLEIISGEKSQAL